MKIVNNVNLAQYTTWKVGGPAEYFVEVYSIEDLREAVLFAKKHTLPFTILGQGTNVLISDKGIKGLVIRNKIEKIEIASIQGKIVKNKKNNSAVIRCFSGVLTNRLVRYSLDERLEGLQNFLGQPGTVGGAVYINAHNMHKQDFFGNYVQSVSTITRNGEEKSYTKEQMRFGYDESFIKHSKEIVVFVLLKLNVSSLTKEALWKEAEKELMYRKEHQPTGQASAGCTFQNISLAEALRLGTPNHTQSAGYIIDLCGLKGTEHGGAQVSTQHANFIVNRKEATAKDIYLLIRHIKQKVKNTQGIALREEIVYLGDFS